MIDDFVDLTQAVLQSKTRREALEGWDKRLRARLVTVMVAMRVKTAEPVDYDGEPLGTVSVARRTTAVVTDPGLFLKWVKERHPTEVVDVPTVRPAYLKGILDAAVKEGQALDGDEAIPGVEVADGDPYLTTSPTAEAYRRGAVDLPPLPGDETSP